MSALQPAACCKPPRNFAIAACRLLAENDQLKTRLARAGLGEPVAAGGFAKKDE